MTTSSSAAVREGLACGSTRISTLADHSLWQLLTTNLCLARRTSPSIMWNAGLLVETKKHIFPKEIML